MNLSNASNHQLKVIMNFDRHCPKELLEKVVNEMLERGMLKDWVMYLSRPYFGRMKSREIKLWLEDLDIIQLGYIGIMKALDKFESGKSAFATFSEYFIKGEWQNHFTKFNSLKRTMDREHVSSDLVINEEGETLMEFLPSYENVEKYVLMKVHFENQLQLLTPLQKATVLGYMQGYQMKEIAAKQNVNRRSADRAFHVAVEKMGGEKISLKENCGMVRGA
jgi:RNA polymerase sigma factor (sigma-70 family)